LAKINRDCLVEYFDGGSLTGISQNLNYIDRRIAKDKSKS